MTDKIEKLTAEQEAAIPAFREECLKKALSTETIDREKAKAAINNLYEAGGFETPDLILFAQSPMQALLMRSALKSFSNASRGQLLSQIQDQLKGQFWGQLRGDQLWDQLRSQLWDQLVRQIENQIEDQIEDRLREQLKHQLTHQLQFQLQVQLWDKLMGTGHHAGVYKSVYFGGAWDYYWLIMYKYAETIGVEYEEKNKKHLDAYIEYADTCGCAYLYEKIAFVCDRPEVMKFDQKGRLSNESESALKFRDGYSLQ